MKALALAIPACICLAASATPLYEPFNYDPTVNTNLIGQTNPDGVTWAQAGASIGLTNQPYIVAGSLSYPGLAAPMGNSVKFGNTTGTNGLAARFSLPSPVTNSTIYFSFLMKLSDLTGLSSSGVFWAALNNSAGSQTTIPSALVTRVISKASGAGYQMGLDKSSGSAGSFQFATNIFTTSDTVFVVGGYTFNNGSSSDDVSQLWVNPDPATFGAATAPTTNVLVSTATGDIASAVINSFCIFNRSSAEPAGIILDELLIGTNWADVTPPPDTLPAVNTPPQSLHVLAGATATFTVRAYRAAAYQWQFNGTALAGGSSASLSLSNVQAANAGSYSVVLTNAAGAITSSVAKLTVDADVYPRLGQIWSIAPGSRPYVTTDASSTPFERSLAYNALSNQVLIVSRTNTAIPSGNPAIYVVDAATGADLYQMNTDTNIINGGGLALSAIDVAADGAVYAGSISTDNSTTNTTYHLYRWASSSSAAVPVKVWQGDPAGQTASPRWGDTLKAGGAGLGTEIILDSNDGKWGALLKPTDSSMAAFTNFPFTNFYGASGIGRSLQFGDTNSFWSKRKAAPLELATYDLAGQTSTVLTNFSGFPSSVGPVAFPPGSPLLCGIDFAAASSTPDTLDLFEVLDLSSPLLLAQYNFPVNHQANANFIGQVVFGTTNVFAVDGNNGIVAFKFIPYRPPLSIACTAGQAIVSWVTNATGYTLYSAPALTNPMPWTPLGAGTVVGGAYVVTNSAAAAGFYRLQQ